MGLGHRRIGLLGGSFNPAHGGHLHISRLALSRLGLDEVWWLVSPQNPLKPAAGMAPFAERLAAAASVAAAERRIRVSDIEARLGSTYTADTLDALRRRFPRDPFRLADGWRQPRPAAILEAVARHFPHRSVCRFRPARHLVQGARGEGGTPLCPGADPAHRRRAVWR